MTTNISDNEVIKKYVEKINELNAQIDELEQGYVSPKYKGGASVVRGGLAMTDKRLGKLRIMIRNIVKFEGADALANEIKNSLTSTEIRQLKNML